MACVSPHHHIGRTPLRLPLFQFFLAAARESSQVWDDINSWVSHSSWTHVRAEKPSQGDVLPLSLLCKPSHSPPVSALGIARKWKMPSFLPRVSHYHEPSLSTGLLWILPSPCSPPKVRRSYAVSLMFQSDPAERNGTAWNAGGRLFFGQEGWGSWPLGTGVGGDRERRRLHLTLTE